LDARKQGRFIALTDESGAAAGVESFMVSTRASQEESESLAAARAGDHEAFRRLIAGHQEPLHAHAYRMLGSLHDADDVMQEALLRGWRGLGSFDGRSSLRTWLYRITTNTCLDAIARRPKRVVPLDYPSDDPDELKERPIAEVPWLEPYPDDVLAIEGGRASPEARYEQREAIELAFVAALQHLPPRQRAVLILRDVLAFSAKEVAAALETSPASVNSALQRARKTVESRVPERSQQATARAIGDDRVREVVQRFGDAFERGDTRGILDLLTEDATFSMPPRPGSFRGRREIAGSWLMPEGAPPRLRVVLTRANGQPAAAVYMLDPDRSRYLPLALDVLTLRDGAIEEVTAFRTPGVFARFGLPPELAA
jgi:RNA polymerase sigma-70 factor (ECF subfamily)